MFGDLLYESLIQACDSDWWTFIHGRKLWGERAYLGVFPQMLAVFPPSAYKLIVPHPGSMQVVTYLVFVLQDM